MADLWNTATTHSPAPLRPSETFPSQCHISSSGDDEDEDEDDGDKGNRVNVTPAQMVAAVCVSKRMNRRERDSKWQPMAELKFVQMLNNVENC